jgi:hypothetical protein
VPLGLLERLPTEPPALNHRWTLALPVRQVRQDSDLPLEQQEQQVPRLPEPLAQQALERPEPPQQALERPQLELLVGLGMHRAAS